MKQPYSEMQLTAMEDDQLRQTLQEAFPDTEPSDLLISRIRHLASQASTAQRPARRHSPRLSFAFGGGLAACAAAMLILTLLAPGAKRSDAAALAILRRAEAAVARINSAHIIRHYLDGNSSNLWFLNGMWRRTFDNGYEILRDGAYWQYDNAKKTVYIGSQTNIGDDRDNGEPTTLSQEIEDFSNAGVKVTVTSRGDAYLNGFPVHVIQLDLDYGTVKTRKRVWIDAATNLPLKAEEPGETVTYQYNVPVDPSLFVTSLPKSATVTDHRIKSLPAKVVKTVTITGAGWYGSPQFTNVFSDNELDNIGATGSLRPDLILTFPFVYSNEDHHQFDGIWMHASRYFVLRAPGHPDVRFNLIGVTAYPRETGAYGAKLLPVQMAKVALNVPYRIVPLNQGDYGWAVAPDLTITLTRPLQTSPDASAPSDVEVAPNHPLRSVSISGTCWADTSDFRSIASPWDMVKLGVPVSARPDLFLTFRYPHWTKALSNRLRDFSKHAGGFFTMHTAGHPDVHLERCGIQNYTETLGAEGARIIPVDRSKIVAGLPYTLIAVNEGPYQWNVAPGVTATKPQ